MDKDDAILDIVRSLKARAEKAEAERDNAEMALALEKEHASLSILALQEEIARMWEALTATASWIEDYILLHPDQFNLEDIIALLKQAHAALEETK